MENDLEMVMDALCIPLGLRERARKNLQAMSEEEVQAMYERAITRKEKTKKLVPYCGK